MYVDPRLNDCGLSYEQRVRLAHDAGLISADHPQLWPDSSLQRAADRARAAHTPCCDRCGQHALEQVLAPSGAFLCPGCFAGRYGAAAETHETLQLFAPAPAPIPGQLLIASDS